VEQSSSCTRAWIAALETSTERRAASSDVRQKASRRAHALEKRGRAISVGRKARKRRVDECSSSTHVSSHCLEAVSREWWRSISTGTPPSLPSGLATCCVAHAAAAASHTSRIIGSSARKSA